MSDGAVYNGFILKHQQNKCAPSAQWQQQTIRQLLLGAAALPKEANLSAENAKL
jgi:hypothetical protein